MSRRPAIELSGAHAVVTGGSSGIGLATAAQLARAGARVSLVARNLDRLEHAAAMLRDAGAQVAIVPADVADRSAIQAALADLARQRGPVDVLVCSAGQTRPGHFLELDDDVFRRLMEVDYFGTLWSIRAVAPGMVERGRGSLVAISSAAGLIGVFGYAAYSPAKFAVRGLMETVRAELSPHGVHVACCYPPDTDTPQLAEEAQWKPAETAAIAGTIKPLTADRVAASIVDGIRHGRTVIAPDAQTKALARLHSVLGPALDRYADHRAGRATR